MEVNTNVPSGLGKMVQWVKVFAAKSGKFSSVPEIPVVKAHGGPVNAQA